VKPPHLSNRQTNWDLFRHLITERLTLKIPLKTPEDIEETVKLFNGTVQWAGLNATPNPPAPLQTHGCPPFIRRLQQNRQLHKRWQHTRTPENKRLLNRPIRDHKQLLHWHDCVQTFLQSLTPTVSTDYSLWKTTKYLKHVTKPSPPLRTRHGTWARSATEKAQAFAEHLVSVFQTYPSSPFPAAEEPILQALEIPYQLEPPINGFTHADTKKKKNPGYELITGKILQELLTIGIKYLTQLFNAVLLLNCFSAVLYML
jgi:hypothetical protein